MTAKPSVAQRNQLESQIAGLVAERREMRDANNIARLILLQHLGEQHAHKDIGDLAALAGKRIKLLERKALL